MLDANIKEMNLKLDDVQERIDLLHSKAAVETNKTGFETNSMVKEMRLMVVDSMI